jgi:rubredoxin
MCDHEFVFDVTGGWHFDGEPWDDIAEHEVCAKCGLEQKEDQQKVEEREYGF